MNAPTKTFGSPSGEPSTTKPRSQRMCEKIWTLPWLPISRKRHQIGHLDFRSFRLLTEGLLVRISLGAPLKTFHNKRFSCFAGGSVSPKR